MASAVFTIGVGIAAALIGLLVLTLLAPGALRIWPTPGPKTWQSYVFWPLFRGLNVLCFAAALFETPLFDASLFESPRADRSPFLGLPAWLRATAFAMLATSIATFVYAFQVLGRDNSYGASDGLVTTGIYQWTRNPQNAMLVVVYGALAIASDSASAYVLCGAMMAVYTLMVLAEEPWLEAIYGEPYRRYCREVPRFFNWRRALQVRA